MSHGFIARLKGWNNVYLLGDISPLWWEWEEINIRDDCFNLLHNYMMV